MPVKAPRICGCGHRVEPGAQCACEVRRTKERKARFDRTRPSARQRGYDAEWDRERAIYLRANPSCRRCGAPASVIDHVIPHKGSKALFWDRTNWQPLCGHCHNSAKQRHERRTTAR